MRHVGNGRLVHSDRLVQWRSKIAWYARQQKWHVPARVPAYVWLRFTLPRPPSHLTKDGHPRHRAPPAPTGHNTGDVDKLVRAVLDALVEGKMLTDDSQVTQLTAAKEYDDDTTPGVTITVMRDAAPQDRP